MEPKDKAKPANHPVLLLPGWLDSDAGHWQTHWAKRHGFERVVQDDWLWPKRGDWMARLDEVLLDTPSSALTLLAAHSLGCHLVAAWAAHSQHAARVAGALLVAPPDLERDDMPPNLFSWRPVVGQPLPFAATVVGSSDDPFCDPARSQRMAAAWGATWVGLGPRGHINSESGLGDWSEGLVMLNALAQRGGR